jgi:6,7-dimethyl-8-ribityllumazine synthase
MPSPIRRHTAARFKPPIVAVVVSRYNASITDRLRDGAVSEYASRVGGSPPEIIAAPGSFELPALALAAARSGKFAGVVAIGCLIKGETSHDRHIAQAVAHGLVSVTLATGVPVAFGVLTVDTPEQAHARAGGDKGNKGQEAMAAVLDTIAEIERLSGKAATARVRPLPDKAARPRKGGSR